jgi:O-antigen ligase
MPDIVQERLRQWVAPAYLLLCLVFGGSAQAVYGNPALQLTGLAILAWTAATTVSRRIPQPALQFLLLATVSLATVLLELLPLPPSLWTLMRSRRGFASGYPLLGLSEPWIPLSLVPYHSLECLFAVIPFAAIFSSITVVDAYERKKLVAALLSGTVLGILLGTLQVGSGDPQSSPWYLYAETNFGSATGFFANANHMATLLVMSVPFLAALVADARRSNPTVYSSIVPLALGALVLVGVGIALNGSLAGYALGVPVAVASALLLVARKSRWRYLLTGGVALLLIGSILALATSSIGDESQGVAGSVQSREEILATTLKAIEDFLPWGSGLGSFRQVYQLYEDPRTVTDTYVVHAHNEYVELTLETGLPGIVCMIAFLFWWAWIAIEIWRTPGSDPFARAATIASAAVLVHSGVDFPVRTAAISACFGMCLALMCVGRFSRHSKSQGSRPSRHVVIR